MWYRLAKFILKFRLLLLVLVGLITVFMGFQARETKMSFQMISIVPEDDPDAVYFRNFKTTFGEDGNIMALAFEDSALYTLDNFRKLTYLVESLESIRGVTGVLGLPNLQKLVKNQETRSFDFEEIFPDIIEDQKQLDSLLNGAASLQFYSGQLINKENGATLLAVSLDNVIINTEARNELIYDIEQVGKDFEEVTGIDVRFGGHPYVRTTNMTKIKGEINLFLILSVIITGLILFFFFRSFKAVFIPLVIIGVVIVWVMGTLKLFGYEITALTGLVPSIIVVIGIPNSVYLLNKYHHEFTSHGDHLKALRNIIRKIGIVTLITNFTTAIGFLVLISTNIPVLVEFGVVAGINIMATFIVSIILIPGIFSYLKPPNPRHLKHLRFKILDLVLTGLDRMARKYRPAIFITTIAIIGISAYGLTKIKAVSYLVDDLPDSDQVLQDLKFFERNFNGIMPLELVVDTKTKNGVRNQRYLRQIDEFHKYLDSVDYISKPISVVSFLKASRQAFYGNIPSFYDLPNSRDRGLISRYFTGNPNQQELIEPFVDSTGQVIRVSMKVADVGSVKMDSLVNDVLRPKVNEIFDTEKITADITGTTFLFVKGNAYLVENLITSMIIAFFIIALIMAGLFKNLKMIVISLIPNIIPMLITGAIMGYFGIPLKPSTALVFSIAFGISVDDSIHFLAKYRQELFANKMDPSVAVSISIRETGASMIYTSIILFFGFIIFSFSQFGGTIALGQLTSITLLFAMLTNVVILPALLLQFDKGQLKTSKVMNDKFPKVHENGIDTTIASKSIEN